MFEFLNSDGIKIHLSPEDWKQIATKETIKEMMSDEKTFAYDICLSGQVVGFALFSSFLDCLFLWQYAIGKEFQGKGIGYAALKELFLKLQRERKVNCFTTTYTYGNFRAKGLYEKLGFVETDVVDEDGVHEVNMELKL